MKKLCLIAVIAIMSVSNAFSHTLAEINNAFISNSALESQNENFSEAIKILEDNENSSFGDIVHATNILLEIRRMPEISINQRAAIDAAIEIASGKLQEINQRGR
jgi:hypothetical protein